MALSTGLALASGSASPPTMMARVAARAPVTPPLTGASRKNTPRALALGSIFRGVEGSTLLRSIKIVPGLARSTRPPASRYTASTSGDAGSEVSTTSDPSTTSWEDRAPRAPAWIKFSMALGFMSKTSMGNPAFNTFPAMGLPMFPTPMKPTDGVIACLLDPDGEVRRLRGRGRIAPDGTLQAGSSRRPARQVCRLRRPSLLLLADRHLAARAAHRNERGAGRAELHRAEVRVLDGPGGDRHIRGSGAVQEGHRDAADHGAGSAAVVVRHGEEVAARAAEGHQRPPDARQRVAAHREK